MLEEKSAIPMVAAQLALLQAIQTDEFWTDVQAVQLEEVRRKLRSLVKLIEKAKRKVVYTAFEDELGEETPVALPDVPVGVDIERLRAKALDFLKKHEQDAVVQKLKWNEPLTGDDLAALEEIFVAEGTSTAGIEEAKRVNNGLGLFVRSLVGLNRAAAKRAFASFLGEKTLAANQIKFVELVIDHLSRSGWLEKRSLYESPFVDMHPSGVDGLFGQTEVQQMLGILTAVRENAQGATRV
jgi:type I restriction enzyme R subunit